MSTSEATLYRLSDEGEIEELQELLSEETFNQCVLDEALHHAVMHCLSASDHIECIGVLINHGASPNYRDGGGVSLLMKAARLGQIQLVQELITRGADVKHRDLALKSALHYALESDFGDNGDVVKMLLDKGAELNLRDHSGAMEVHKAAKRGYLSSLTHILEAKGQVNAADEAGNTPLHLAAATENQNVECVKALLKHGAKVNIRNKEGLTVGSFAGAEVLSILGSDAPESGISENGETVDEAAQTYGEYEKAQETLSELNSAIEAERSKRISTEAKLKDLKDSIAKLKDDRQKFREDSESKLSSLLATIEKTRKERTALESSLKSHSPSLLFPTTVSQIYSHEELESALERDIADLCAQVDAWQVAKRSSHEEVIAYWRSLVEESIPGATIHVYGSYASRLHLPASDIDFVICESPLPVIRTLEVLYERVGRIAQVHDQRLITTAVIPVLRLSLSKYDVKVDLTVQESTHRGLKCTEVCRSLLLKLPLLRNVFFALKFLLHYGEANEAFKGGLGSYGLLLMIASLMEKRRTYTCAASLIDFFKYFVHECDYLQPIAIEGENMPTSSFEEPMLYVPDPSHPQSNVARSSNLEFLLHFLQVAEQKLWTRPFCGCPVGPLSLMVLETREWMCRS